MTHTITTHPYIIVFSCLILFAFSWEWSLAVVAFGGTYFDHGSSRGGIFNCVGATARRVTSSAYDNHISYRESSTVSKEPTRRSVSRSAPSSSCASPGTSFVDTCPFYHKNVSKLPRLLSSTSTPRSPRLVLPLPPGETWSGTMAVDENICPDAVYSVVAMLGE